MAANDECIKVGTKKRMARLREKANDWKKVFKD